MKFYLSKRVIPQIQATLYANSTNIVSGIMATWLLPIIPRLTDTSDPDHLTMDQIGWIVSTAFLGLFIGPFVAGFLADRIGRRRTLLLSILPISIFYVIIGFMKISYVGSCIAQFFAGMSGSSFMSIMPMYIGEIIEGNICDAMASLGPMFFHIGTLFSATLAPILSVHNFAHAFIAVVILTSFCITRLPESPYLLCMDGKIEEAWKSLTWLRGSSDVTDELLKIQKYTAERKTDKTGLLGFVRTGDRRTLLLILCMSLTNVFSGAYFVQTYGTLIFQEAGFVVSGNLSLIILNSILIPPSFLGAYCIKKFGRRVCLGVSVYSIGSLLLLAAIYYNLKSHGFDVSPVAWLPLVALVTSCSFSVAGVMGVVMVIIAEVFPINIKAAASTLTILITNISGCVSLKVFQVVEEQYGTYVVFYAYAASILTFGTCFFVILPETKGQIHGGMESDFKKNHHRLSKTIEKNTTSSTI